MLFYQLPTARQKKHKVRKARDKRLLSLNRELTLVRDQIRNLGYEDLPVPYQQGWQRSFVLRYDVTLSARAAFFEGILKKINTGQYSTRKDFKKKRRRRGRSGYEVRLQELKKPDMYEFLQMKFTEEEARWFQVEDYWCPYGKCEKTRYVFREPWRFVLKVQPHMITQKKRLDADLEARMDELNSIIYRYPAQARLDWLLDRGYKWYKQWGYREDVKLPENPFRNKQKEQVIWDLCYIEHITPENTQFELFV